jgi:predicted GH43/DUF377 family glycosyl hydrolase
MDPKHPLTGPLRAVALALSLAGCSAETASLTPLQWVKVPGPGPNGALLGPGATNAFDERANFTTDAFRDGDRIRLYYGGSDATGAASGISCGHWRIGMADSADGVAFTRVPGDGPGGAMLDNGPAGSFDSQLTYRPVVLKDGLLYRMWFNGSAGQFNCPPAAPALNRRIGYAESTDGIHWTKFYDGDGPGGSVLPLGAADAIDGQQVGYVSVIKDGAEYKMFYSANDANNTWRVALATSADARHWTKKPGKVAGGAILDVGPAGSFDFACAYQPTVVKEREQLYRMWYRGCVARGVANGPSRGTIGYAESNDGITWVKIPQPTADGAALEVGTAPAFDSGGLTTPSVFLDASGWNMYYAGFDTLGQYSAGLARAAP